jgi:DNA modification methylase
MLIRADARQIPLADKSVHCVVTSPPYWGLRDYGIGDRQLGLEPTPEEYIYTMVRVFREVWRVLRDDGTLWLNMGDSYCSGTSTARTRETPETGKEYGLPRNWVVDANKIQRNGTPAGYKPKDLIGMPWMLALALRGDGWYLRSDIIWSKPNAMPESVEDRPTTAHEHIFLMAKSERYFYDAEAIKEPVTGTAHSRGEGVNPKAKGVPPGSGNKQNKSWSAAVNGLFEDQKKNKRTVWEVSPQGFPDAHFATFPEELIKPCILAGTSMKGACAKCGTPWERIIETSTSNESGSGRAAKKRAKNRLLFRVPSGWHQSGSGRWKPQHVERFPVGKMAGGTQAREDHDVRMGPTVSSRTIDWAPTCTCGVPDVVPCIVFDPFMGSGTTELVARNLQCRAVGLELNQEYLEIAKKRLAQQVMQFHAV